MRRRVNTTSEVFFPRGYRENLVTVTSCADHNHDQSLDNLYQRATMSTGSLVPLESLFDDEIDLVLRELGEQWQ